MFLYVHLAVNAIPRPVHLGLLPANGLLHGNGLLPTKRARGGDVKIGDDSPPPVFVRKV